MFIDGLLNFSAKLMQLFSYPVRLLQTGMFSSYAMLILVGLVVLLAYYGTMCRYCCAACAERV